MPGSCFLDSNIILYAYMTGRDPRKATALNILENPNCIISSQVIAEVCYNLIKKSGVPEPEIIQIIEEFYSLFPVTTLEKETYLTASRIRSKHHFSYWDSIITASAVLAGCTILYSEDLHSGQLIDGVRIINPFKTLPPLESA